MRSNTAQPRERQRDSEKLRATQILNAASALLAEAGSDGFTAAAVARRAGVNKALIFYYWGSVADLFERVLQGYYDSHRAALETALSTPGTKRERVHRLVDTYFDFMQDNRAYVRIVQHQIAGGGPYAAVVQRHYAEITQWALSQLEPLVPSSGATSPRHLHLSISAVVVNYFTYAPGLAEAWGHDPLSADALGERRAHVQWLVDACLDSLERGG